MKMKNGNQYKIQKSQNGGGNNANKNFMSQVEQGSISNTTCYLELFMNTIKIKDFCNRYQYEMQIIWDGGGSNAFKIFMSRVEEEYIPNTISYVQLFMTIMKMKNNFCDGYQYEIQKSQDGGWNNAYKIFTSRVKEGYVPNTISYVKLFMTTMKMKNNFFDGYQYEIQKRQYGGGNNAHKIFTCRVEEGYIPNTISDVKLFMTTMKMKNNFCDGYQYEIRKKPGWRRE